MWCGQGPEGRLTGRPTLSLRPDFVSEAPDKFMYVYIYMYIYICMLYRCVCIRLCTCVCVSLDMEG